MAQGKIYRNKNNGDIIIYQGDKPLLNKHPQLELLILVRGFNLVFRKGMDKVHRWMDYKKRLKGNPPGVSKRL